MADGSIIETNGDRPSRLVVYGRPADRFKALLPAASVWRRFAGLEVVHARTRLEILGKTAGRPSYVLPIWGTEAMRVPPWWWMLRPDRVAVEVFHDKLQFARFARREGLEALVPRSYLDGEAPQFPLAMKPIAGTDGRGVSFAADAPALAARLAEPALRGRRLALQERLDGTVDFVTHVMCRGGRVLWHCSYRYQLAESGVQTSASIIGREPHRAPPEDIASFERFLKPLGYDGPATIDWRRRADGRPAVFEINPRFGGSLMRPENEPDLAAALAVLLANARPPRWAERQG